MKNLTLARKMLLLSAILMTSIILVAGVAVNQLKLVNSEIQNLVDHTMQKSSAASELQVSFLDSIRTHKNSILSSDDEGSQRYGSASRTEMSEAFDLLSKLETLIARDNVEEQKTSVASLRKDLDELQKINEETLSLSVQNSNVKARRLLAGDVQRFSEILGDRFQTWADQISAKTQPDPADQIRMKSIYECHRLLLELQPTAISHIESSDSEEMDGYKKKLNSLIQQIQQSLPDAAGAEYSGSQADLRSLFTDVQDGFSKVLQLSELDTNNRSTTLSLTTFKLVGDNCAKRISDLQRLLSAEASAGRLRGEQAYSTARQWILSALLGGLILGAVVAWLVTRSVTLPVFEVRNLAQSMASGDLRQRLQLDQTDEIGQLSVAANTLADSLSRIVHEIQKVSDGLGGSAADLTGVSNQLLTQSEQTSLQSTSVASASEQLSSNISTMAAAAEEMSMNVASISSASEEMSMNIGTISSAAEQTSTNVSAVSTAVTEISGSFADVLSNVQEGSRVAGDARRMADSATQTIELLNQSGAEISKVTEAIKMIALQTNLLALNATIEATSAGEAGKGFAVVAHEIKELANQSGKAAEDIARKIEGVQNDTRQAVQVIQGVSRIINEINSASERISKSVEKQTRAASMISQNVGEANKGVGDIARSISEVAKAAGDMSRNVAEAARGATDVSRNVGEAAKAAGGISSSIHAVSESSRSTNQSATRVHDSAEQLDRIGKELRKLVGRFKVNAEETETA
jgi:methyl-accepting chemotaxis protein